MKVYFDNAATTPLAPEVLKEMLVVLEGKHGNPSSIHAYGREAKSIVEKARKSIATMLNCSPAELFFTSGGTEADNMAIRSAVDAYKITHIISSPLEHHAVLHTIEDLEHKGVKKSHVKLTDNGHIDLKDLERLLKENPRSLVSLMHANNEIGNLLDIVAVGELCAKYDALFHSDTVQSVCHYPIDLQKMKVHFITGAAHKFHGPKGIGFIYVNSSVKVPPLIYGGGQERNMRGGTENVSGIVGLAKAMDIAHKEMKEHAAHIQDVRSYMKSKLEKNIQGIEFNGDVDAGLYTVLNVMFPVTPDAEMLLMKLDIDGIAASGGSACSSGSSVGSHVIAALGKKIIDRPVIRFSFSKYSTKAEVDYVVGKLVELFPVKVVA